MLPAPRKALILQSLEKRASKLRFLNPMHYVRNAAAAPVKGSGNVVKNFLFGRVQQGGRFAGTRMRPTGKAKSINQSEYDRLLREAKLPQGKVGTGKFDPKTGAEITMPGAKGAKVPEVFKQRGPDGQMQYFKQDYKPGGAVGLMAKHPLITAGVGGVGYLLYKNRQNLPKRPNPYAAQQQAPSRGPAANQVQSMAVQNPWG